MPDIRKKMLRGKGTKDDFASTLSTKKALSHFMSHKNGDFLNTPIDQLEPDPEQPRKLFDQTKLEELSFSIREKGILQPILIRIADDDKFWIVAGERRYRAAKMAGLNSLPCIVTTGDPGEISLLENIQRDDLKPLELVNAFEKIMETHGYSQTQLGKVIGKSPKTVSAILSIKKLPDPILEDLSCAQEKTEDYKPISKRTLIEIAKEPPEIAKELYAAAKKGITSSQIRNQRQAPNRRSEAEIIDKKIMALIKSFEKIDDPNLFKTTLRPSLQKLKSHIDKILKKK